jgi:hypothetical protein
VPSTNAKPRAFKTKFSAAFAIVMLLIPAAFAADEKDKDKDQLAYCEYKPSRPRRSATCCSLQMQLRA